MIQQIRTSEIVRVALLAAALLVAAAVTGPVASADGAFEGDARDRAVVERESPEYDSPPAGTRGANAKDGVVLASVCQDLFRVVSSGGTDATVDDLEFNARHMVSRQGTRTATPARDRLPPG